MADVERGARLKELREAAGLLQRQVGAVFNIDKAAVSEWEKGKSNPSRSRLRQLDDMYNAKGEVLALFDVGANPDEMLIRLESNLDQLAARIEERFDALDVRLTDLTVETTNAMRALVNQVLASLPSDVPSHKPNAQSQA